MRNVRSPAQVTKEICPSCKNTVQALEVGEELRTRIVRHMADGSPTLALAELMAETGISESDARAWLDHFDSCVGAWPLSSEDNAVLHDIDTEFGPVPRPDHFADPTHCPECADHDSTLLARPREALRRKDLGNPGWDPVTFCSAEGVAHLMPTLAKFALAPDLYADREWYGGQLAWHLSYEGAKNPLFNWCSSSQRRAIARLVQHIVASRSAEIDNAMCESEFEEANKLWAGRET